MVTGQLSLGVVKVVDPANGDLLGYAFTEISGAGQLQRWLLHRDPLNALEIAPAPEEMRGWSLSDWRSKVPSLWRKNAYYVWAQTDVYEYGKEYFETVWDTFPRDLPMATYYQKSGNFQLDPTGLLPEIRQSDSTEPGIVYVESGLAAALKSASGRANSCEYWYLPPGFLPAGAGARTVISPGSASSAEGKSGFREMVSRRWGPGSVFAITGCTNYVGELPPTDL